jgi:hypothetical protein
VTAADVRRQLARGLNRVGAARALGTTVGTVNRLLAAENLLERFAVEHLFREFAARGKACATCGGPAADIYDGRPLCRDCLCPDPTLAERAAERTYYATRGTTALGEAASSPVDRWAPGEVSMKGLRRRLAAACRERGIPNLAARGIMFGAPMEGAP